MMDEEAVVHELDVIALNEPVGKWPVGTEGTLINAFSTSGLVEIADDDGYTLDTIAVPYFAMNVVWSAEVAERVH